MQLYGIVNLVFGESYSVLSFLRVLLFELMLESVVVVYISASYAEGCCFEPSSGDWTYSCSVVPAYINADIQYVYHVDTREMYQFIFHNPNA